MQRAEQNNRQSLSAQQENPVRDSGLSQDEQEAIEKVKLVDQNLEEAWQAVSEIYDRSSTSDQKRLDIVEHDLYQASSLISRAAEVLKGLALDRQAELKKDEKSQFNAAARGEKRSVAVQQAKQKAAAQQKKVVPISASRGIGEKTQLEQSQGKAKRSFGQAANGKPVAAEQQGIGSKQVRKSMPKPQLKPGPKLGHSVDAASHRQAKSEDAERAAKANKALEAIAKGLRDRAPQGQGQENEKGLGQGGQQDMEL